MSRKKIIVSIASITCILLVVVIFWQFSFVLRNVFISHSGFISKDQKAYFSPDLPPSLQDSLSVLLQKAEQRNISFWGIADHKYKIVFCANQTEMMKYSGSEQNQTISHHTLLGTFIVLGKEGFDLDIISHELCHSFFWSQMGYFDKHEIPTWFDEGLACQLDYRAFFNDTVLDKKYVTNFDILRKIETPEQFYRGGWPLIKQNYIIARIEIKQFLASCGTKGIHLLIENLNKGDDFITSYRKIKETCHGASRLLGEGNRENASGTSKNLPIACR